MYLKFQIEMGGARQLCRHTPNLFLGRAVEDDADFFESD